MGDELMEKFNFDNVNIRNILSYALYPKVYDDYCTHLQHYNDVSRLDSHVYFYGLKKGEETVLKASQGRDILIQGDHPDETRPCKFVVDAFTEVKVGDIRCNVKPHKCFAFSLEGNEERIA